MSSVKRVCALVLAAMAALSLVSCSESESAGEALIKPVERSAGSSSGSTRTAEVTVGEISRTMATDASVTFATKDIYCEFSGARFAEYYVSAGDIVEEGAPIARFTIESSAAERQRLEAELEIAESETEQALEGARSGVSAAREALAAADRSDARGYRRAELALERAQLQLEAAQSNAAARVSEAQEMLDEFNERSAEDTVYSPARGCIYSLESFGAGLPVEYGSRVCTFISYEDIAVTASSDITGAPRYGERAVVKTDLFDGEIESRVLDAPINRGEDTGAFTLEIPDEVMEAANAALASDSAGRFMPRIRVEVERFSLDGAVTVPNDALKSEEGRRYVYVMRDGTPRKRFVVAGLADEKNTQILAGLEPGEYVSVG